MKRTYLFVALFVIIGSNGFAAAKKLAPKPKKAAPAATAELSEDQLRAALEAFQKPGVDAKALTEQFRPTHEDFLAVFDPAAASKAEAFFASTWSREQITAKPDETDLKLHHATTDELLAGAPPSNEFPLGWRTTAKWLKKGLTFYAWRFAKPGDKGTLFDGIVAVNGHFAWFPKIWNAVK
jgi:hypothetical protein